MYSNLADFDKEERTNAAGSLGSLSEYIHTLLK
jgi:hypothetical protein